MSVFDGVCGVTYLLCKLYIGVLVVYLENVGACLCQYILS